MKRRAIFLCYIKLCALVQIHRWISNWSYSPETLKSGPNRRFFVPCDLEIWRMTLKNRTPLLCCFKLCASFHIHQWIQTGCTVRKRPLCVEIDYLFSRVILNFDRWPCKTIGQLFYVTSSFGHHYVAISEFKLELQFGNAQLGGQNRRMVLAVWPWKLMDALDKQ